MAGRSAMAADQPTIRILINQSPWLNCFIAMVDEYQKRNRRDDQARCHPVWRDGGKDAQLLARQFDGTYDIVNINSAGMAEMYATGLC